MRYRVTVSEEAAAQRRLLPPAPKQAVRRALREMEEDPYPPGHIRLDRPEVLFRVRVGDYRTVYRPGPGAREVTVTRIGHRESVYEGLERSADA